MAANESEHDTSASMARPASPQLDPAKYRGELDAFDITEAQKQELLLTLWSVMQSFVELGFSADVGAAVVDGLMAIPAGDDLS